MSEELREKLKTYQEALAVATEALEFYAPISRYKVNPYDSCEYCTKCGHTSNDADIGILEDDGRTAREALAKLANIESVKINAPSEAKVNCEQAKAERSESERNEGTSE